MTADASVQAVVPIGERGLAPPPLSLPAPVVETAAADGLSFGNLDRIARAAEGRFTQGVSPNAMTAASVDWASHLMRAPGRQLELSLAALSNVARFQRYAWSAMTGGEGPRPFPPQSDDHRFDAPE